MKQLMRPLAVVAACVVLALPHLAAAQVSSETLKSITTPDKVETRIGTLDFKDGMPSKETVAKVYDNLDFTHAFEAFVNTLQGVSVDAIRKGFLEHWGEGQRSPRVLRADGCQVAVPDGQRGHRLFLQLHRPHQGAHGARGAAQGSRCVRRLSGFAGSRISACPVPIGAKAGNT